MTHRPLPHRPKTHRTPWPVLVLSVALVLFVGVKLLWPVIVETAIIQSEDHPSALANVLVRDFVKAQRYQGLEGKPLPTPLDVRVFTVTAGTSSAQVARNLANAGLIDRPVDFLLPLYERGIQGQIQAGTYPVGGTLTPDELASRLLSASAEGKRLTVIEGWRLSQIATEVNKLYPKLAPAAFMAAAVAGPSYTQPSIKDLPAGTSLEGFLYPDTYYLAPDATPVQIVRLMLDNFEIRVGKSVREAAAKRKLSPSAVVAIASIIERESQVPDEDPVIASVYWNRIDKGMRLQADPTVQYALGDWKELSLKDLETDSPYNTYRRVGLPPTPICSPGLSSLLAAAKPAATDFFFFVAKSDGSNRHAFAVSVTEHEANRIKYGNVK